MWVHMLNFELLVPNNYGSERCGVGTPQTVAAQRGFSELSRRASYHRTFERAESHVLAQVPLWIALLTPHLEWSAHCATRTACACRVHQLTLLPKTARAGHRAESSGSLGTLQSSLDHCWPCWIRQKQRACGRRAADSRDGATSGHLLS